MRVTPLIFLGPVHSSLLGVIELWNTLYHLLKIPNLYLTDGHFQPKILGNLMIKDLKEILTKYIMLYAHLGPPVILVKHLLNYPKKIKKSNLLYNEVVSMHYFFFLSFQLIYIEFRIKQMIFFSLQEVFPTYTFFLLINKKSLQLTFLSFTLKKVLTYIHVFRNSCCIWNSRVITID